MHHTLYPRHKRARITASRMAGLDHAVRTIVGGRGDVYRREPCPGCPWRLDTVGTFPPEAFAHSASVAYDAALNTFACHDSGAKTPATCAGFLLRNSYNNMAVRIKLASGAIDLDEVKDGGHELHPSYRAMAVANGLPVDHPSLQSCRDDDDGRTL